jgi:hypothetical protein
MEISLFPASGRPKPCAGIRRQCWYSRWYKLNASIACTNIRDNHVAMTELEVRNSKPGAKIVKLSDGGGLQLWIDPKGAKRWRLAYRFNSTQRALAIGVYPATGLKEAREARDGAKRLLAEGQDPNQAKRQIKAAQIVASANTFAGIAKELLAKKRREGKAETTLGKLD